MSDYLINKEIVELLEYKDEDSILEFGVATGNTLSALIENLIEKQYTKCKIFGFDSFEGLPKESELISENLSDWQIGAFNIIDELKNKIQISSTKEGIEYVSNRLASYNLYTKLIIGKYENTLNTNTCVEYSITPACYIHIDCDIYISTIQVLQFLLSNNLIKNNCIIRYDDWLVPNNLQGKIGEERAHNEICEKFNLKFEKINTKLGLNAAVFRYIS